MFNILSSLFRYFFIFIIYAFIFGIIRLIYMDIKTISEGNTSNSTYLKLVNRKDSLPFRVREAYTLKEIMTVGRSKENDLVLKDQYISNQHAKITLDEDQFFLEDLDSANGTYLNGDRLIDVVKLMNGDRIRFGQVEFLFVSKG